MSTFTKDQTVYNRHGVTAVYECAVPNGHLVRLMVERCYDDGSEPYPDDELTFWPECFSVPETVVLSKQVLDLQERLADYRGQLNAVMQGVRDCERDRLAMLVRIKATDGLQALDDYISGKITHLVTFENGARIKPIEEYKVEHNKPKLRLLSLYGDSKGKLDWGLSEYGDGSGSWTRCVPCTSREQALQVVKSWLEQTLKNRSEGEYAQLCAARSASELGIEIPAEWAAKLREASEKERARRKEDLIRQIENSKAALAALETTP